MKYYDHTCFSTGFTVNCELFLDYRSRAMWNCVIAGGFGETAPGWGLAKRADCFVLQLALSGKGWLETQNRRFTFEGGDLIFLNCHLPYEMGTDPEDPWSFYWIGFDSATAHNWVEELGCDKNPILHPSNCKELTNQFKRVLKLAQSKPLGFQAQVSTIIHRIVADLFVESLKNIPARKKSSVISLDCLNEACPAPLRKALQFISIHFFKITRISDIADHSGVSRSHLHGLFQKHLNTSPMAYIMQQRIQKACELLQHTNLPVKEISFQVGIADESYFSRLFRRKIGESPRQHRIKNNRLLKLPLTKYRS